MCAAKCLNLSFAGNRINKTGAGETTLSNGYGEPARVPEFFVCGVERIEQMGGVARHVLVSKRWKRGKLFYVPEVHIVISNADAQIAILKTARELAIELVGGYGHPSMH